MAAIIDSQSIKGTPESCLESGFDGGKLLKGRKRNILVDTMSCLIIIRVFTANVFDGKATHQLITELFSLPHPTTKPGPTVVILAQSFPIGSGIQASTCYLVDGWLKEPLPGQFDHVD